MKNISVLLLSVCALSLSACGGGKKLSFKNSDELIKSYSAVTQNMTESERQEFRRNMFMIFLTQDTDPTFNNVLSAINYDKNAVEFTGPDGPSLAKELALKLGERLDGKSVSEINKIGEDLIQVAKSTKVQEINKKVATVESAIETLEADKGKWRERNKEAALAEEKFVADTAKYGFKVAPSKITKAYGGGAYEGKVFIDSPYDDPIYDFRYNLTLEHDGYYTFFNGALGRINSYSPGAVLRANLDARNFVNDKGQNLPKDYEFPTDPSAYSYTARPIWVRTSGKVNGWTEYDYKLSAQQSRALNNLPDALKACDNAIEQAVKVRDKFAEHVVYLENGEYEKTRSLYARYQESCS